MSFQEKAEEAMRDFATNAPDHVQGEVAAALHQVALDARDRFVASVGVVVKGGSEKAKKIQDIAEKGLRMKAKAVMAKTPEEARNYANAYDSCVRALRTEAKAQAVVASDEAAAWLTETFKAAADMLGSAVVSLFGAMAQAAVRGVVSGLVGEGEGSSGGSIFPG